MSTGSWSLTHPSQCQDLQRSLHTVLAQLGKWYAPLDWWPATQPKVKYALGSGYVLSMDWQSSWQLEVPPVSTASHDLCTCMRMWLLGTGCCACSKSGGGKFITGARRSVSHIGVVLLAMRSRIICRLPTYGAFMRMAGAAAQSEHACHLHERRQLSQLQLHHTDVHSVCKQN
jgi:hypothetical protein